MKTISRILCITAALGYMAVSQRTEAQNTCATALSFGASTCATLDIQGGTNSTNQPTGCTATSTVGKFYTFTPTAANGVITFALGNPTLLSTTTTWFQLFSGSCTSLTAVGSCQTINSDFTFSGLTPGQPYWFRLSAASTTSGAQSNRRRIDVCINYAPTNDECTGATSLTSSTTCNDITGTLAYSAASSPAVSTSCGTAGADVWYRFQAKTGTPTIALSSIGSSLSGSTTGIQLFSGSCGALTSLACASGTGTSLSLNLSAVSGFTPLTVGDYYYVRIYGGGTATGSGTWSYNICVTDGLAGEFDFGRSYINLSKSSGGGTVNPGDTLEMRAIFTVKSRTADSLSFRDTLYAGKGLRLVPGSIVLRTNEGKAYKSFTDDATDVDAGWYTTSGTDTIVNMNFGLYASRTARGSLTNTSRPSVYTSTCIVMATYRVVVYAPYNTKINYRSGELNYRDRNTGTVYKQLFTRDSLIVYSSPGLCPNAVSATNALGAEFNGTFGTPSGSTPLARNRGTSAYTSYKYQEFTQVDGGPNDYYYGIANNTSSRFTTLNNFAKPDGGGYRVFNLWDISGDHTGASNTAKGNVPCDTTKPVSATNPCGYMLVINSAYRADTAFTYTVNNLCPNTYYELSAWFKNICYRCGCDSTGAGSGTAGYIPSGPGDSSGVQPNIAFDVNGFDYFTTGNIAYAGTTNRGSDSTNIWVKRGFVYLTGPSETSFRLTLRNNAPGGGGNDWALDDISVATCLPNMSYSPSLNPQSCMNNTVEINDTVRTFFANYTYFKWQRSVNNGTTWTDIAGASGNASLSNVSGGYQFITTYTIPPTATNLSDSGNKYRVVVATTSTNLANSNCLVTDGVSIINLQVNNCYGVLESRLLSFDAKAERNAGLLSWSAVEDQEQVWFDIERSYDGSRFEKIATVDGNNRAGINAYVFADSAGVNGQTSYRINMYNQKGVHKYSRIVVLNAGLMPFQLSSVSNPFRQSLRFTLSSPAEGRAEVRLLDLSGKSLAVSFMQTHPGLNAMNIDHLDNLPAGMYVLRVALDGQTVNYKVVRQ